MPSARLAMLIDAENIAAGHFPAILEQVSKLGELNISSIFGDFSGNKLAGWLAHARTHGLQTVLQLSGGKGKNSADMAIAVAAMDILHGGGISAVCLVSSDRDFRPLVQRLRAGLLDVYGFGMATTDAGLRQLCSSFFVLDPAVDVVAAPRKRPAPSATAAKESQGLGSQRLIEAMRDTFAQNAQDGWLALSVAGALLRRREGNLATLLAGKGKLLKVLRASGSFEIEGSGTAIRVRPKLRAVVS
jgi:hypothetical protein